MGTFGGFNAFNTTFMQHDFLKTFPPHFLGKYDIVHIRLMCLALRQDEWEPALKNIMSLLSMHILSIKAMRVLTNATEQGLPAIDLQPYVNTPDASISAMNRCLDASF